MTATRIAWTALVAWLLFYVATFPLAWFWIDCIKDWSAALHALAAGDIPLSGTNIIGAGNNGPLLFWLYMLVLWVVPLEWALPAVSTSLAVVAVAWSAWLLRRDPGAPWLLLLLGTFSLAFELSRIGSDPAFFPMTAPLLLWAWRRYEAEPLRAGRAATLGFVCALGTQLYVAYLPVAVAVGLEIARLLLHKSKQGTPLQDSILVLLSYCLAMVLPFVPTLAMGDLQPQLLDYGSAYEYATTAWRLFAAYPAHMAVRASVVAPWLVWPLTVLGWIAMVAPLLAPLLVRSLPRGQWIAIWTFASGILLTSYPDRVHYHHFGHLAVSYFAAHAVLGYLLLLLRQRLVLAAAIFLQAAFLLAVTQHAYRTGFVIYGNIFPTVLPGQVDLMPTLQARQGVYTALADLGIHHPLDRQRLVHGELEFPFWANGWSRLGEVDRFEPLKSLRSFLLVQPSPTTPSVAGVRLYRCGEPIGGEIRVRPELCLYPDAGPLPIPIRYRDTHGQVIRRNWNDAILASGPEAERFFVQALSTPLTIETGQANRLVVRGLRPSRIVSAWTEPMWTLQPELHEIQAQFNYPLAEHIYALPQDVTEVTLLTRSVILDLELRIEEEKL